MYSQQDMIKFLKRLFKRGKKPSTSNLEVSIFILRNKIDKLQNDQIILDEKIKEVCVIDF